MEEYLDEAEELLRDVIQSRDISTLVVLHHLCDLAWVLDNLKLYDECHLTGNCALALADALGRRSLEFRHEQAGTLSLIAGLSVYQPRACTLFGQAIFICEEVVENNASHSNKYKLFIVLHRAGYLVKSHPSAQWLERAVQLMTKELPPTMVDPRRRSAIYNNYGTCLGRLEQYSNAFEACHKAVSIRRTLGDNAKHDPDFAQTLMNMGSALFETGKYDDAIAAYEEVLGICTTMSTQDPLRYNDLRAKALLCYGVTLQKLNQVSEAAEVGKQAVSLLRNLAQTGKECTNLLCYALHKYGISCALLGLHEEAVLVYQESICLRRALAATDSEGKKYLIWSLHDLANSFRALDKYAEANTAAIEALEKNRGRVLEGCLFTPIFSACVVCQRGIIPDSLQIISPPLPFFRFIFSPRVLGILQQVLPLG